MSRSRTPPTSDDPSRPPRGVAGRVVGGIAVCLGGVFLALAGVFAYAVHETEQDTRRAEAVRLKDDRGAVHDPLASVQTARYEDGVKVALSPPRRVAPLAAGGRPGPDARTFAFSVTYTNGSDSPLSFDADYAEPMNAWAGGPREGREPRATSAVDLVNRANALAHLPAELAPGRRLTVPLRYSVADGEGEITFMYAATDLRDNAYWRLALPE